MRITINTNKSNKIFTVPIERILDDIAYTMYDLSKVNFISITKDRVAKYFRDCQMDEFIDVIKCIILNQSEIDYTIDKDEDEIEELEKDCNFTDIFKVTYNEIYHDICEIISGFTKNGLLFTDTNFEIALNYFINESAMMIESLQFNDVYKYYEKADYNSEDEFITMLPKKIRALAAETITHIKDENNDFDINNPYDVEQLIDNLCVCNEGFINMLRDSTIKHNEIEAEVPSIELE